MQLQRLYDTAHERRSSCLYILAAYAYALAAAAATDAVHAAPAGLCAAQADVAAQATIAGVTDHTGATTVTSGHASKEDDVVVIVLPAVTEIIGGGDVGNPAGAAADSTAHVLPAPAAVTADVSLAQPRLHGLAPLLKLPTECAHLSNVTR
jgi:hypothetical protein